MGNKMHDKICFQCKGHPNILGTHRNTLEFTKHDELSRRGDCIIGVSSDFDAAELKKFSSLHSRFFMQISCGGILEKVKGSVNKDFNDSHEIVVRLSDYASGRTFGIRADKSAAMLDRRLIKAMADKDSIIEVEISPG